MMETPNIFPLLPSSGAPRPFDLVSAWRRQAVQYEHDGMGGAARLLHRVAGELEEAIRAEADTLLSLTDAARLSGYAADSLGRMVRTGRLTNYGRKHSPKLRIGDLPLRVTGSGVESASRHRLAGAGETGAHHATTSEDRAA